MSHKIARYFAPLLAVLLANSAHAVDVGICWDSNVYRRIATETLATNGGKSQILVLRENGCNLTIIQAGDTIPLWKNSPASTRLMKRVRVLGISPKTINILGFSANVGISASMMTTPSPFITAAGARGLDSSDPKLIKIVVDAHATAQPPVAPLKISFNIDTSH